MAVATWDQTGERFYETGVDNGMLYVPTAGVYDAGYAWNGLVSVTETPSGAEPTSNYANNVKYMTLYSVEEFAATLEAYTYPDEFKVFDGMTSPVAGLNVSGQGRSSFGLSFRTKVGNDQDGMDHGYMLHLLYGLTASPSERAFSTVNESPEAITFSWELTSVPAAYTAGQPTSLITVDSRTADPTSLAALEDLLYGTVATDPSLPTPDEVVTTLTP